MKKSSFVAMIMGTIGIILLSLGMCMCLLPEWNAFRQGIVLGVGGIVELLLTMIVWRKMEHKSPIKLEKKTVGFIFLGLVGSMMFGVGMCLTMVWSNMVLGIIIGIIGIVILLSLIPFTRGFTDSYQK